MFSPTMPMNTEWFKQRLADRKLSQRKMDQGVAWASHILWIKPS